MKQNMLILFSLCLILILVTGCSQEDNISSNEIFYQSSSEITSSESEESEISSEENNQPEASSRSNLPENHQQIIESSESAAKESIPENNTLPPSNAQSIAPPQYNEPVEETPPTTCTNEGNQVFQLVNQRRIENGLTELTYRNDIQDAANIRANEIISTFSHTRPDGSSCFTSVNVNYYAIGENIASGQKSAAEVMNAWMNSPGHRANILSKQFTGIAVGVVQYQGVSYWVQIFIG